MEITEACTKSNLFDSTHDVECPFVWGVSRLLVKESSNILERLLEKEDIAEEYNVQFKCSIFVVQLLLSYELYNLGNVSNALQRLEWCEHELTQLDGSRCQEPFYLDMRRPLWHVTLATRSFIEATGNVTVNSQFFENHISKEYSLSLFTNAEEACLYGLKSMCFLEYGFNGNMAALKWAKRALEKNPAEAEWHFLTGKCMGRVRRCTKKFSGVSREEVELIERAVAISPNPKYIMYVAQVYQQSASAAFIHHRDDGGFYKSNLYRAINNMNKKAVELYQQALVFRPNCSYTYIRCLNGLLKLPRKYLNLTQVREMVEKVTEISPNNTMFLHTAGLYFLKLESDPKKALKYLEKASEQGNYGASMDAIRLRFRMNESYNPIGRLKQLIGKFTAEPHHEDAVTQLGSFYLFVVRDLERAINVYKIVMDRNPESRAMTVHKPIFIRMTRPVNLYELLTNEVKVYELKGRYLDAKLKQYFLSVMAQHFPHLLEREMDTQMIHRIIRDHRRMGRAEMRRRAIFKRMLSTEKPKNVEEKKNKL